MLAFPFESLNDVRNLLILFLFQAFVLLSKSPAILFLILIVSFYFLALSNHNLDFIDNPLQFILLSFVFLF